MLRSIPLSRMAIALALSTAAPFALAQVPPASAPTPEHPQSGAYTHTPPFQSPPAQNENPTKLPPMVPQGKSGLMGQHAMTGTVESVSDNDIVKVHTDDGTLTVHFPKASQNLKKGDKITLHLSYSMPQPPASASSS